MSAFKVQLPKQKLDIATGWKILTQGGHHSDASNGKDRRGAAIRCIRHERLQVD